MDAVAIISPIISPIMSPIISPIIRDMIGGASIGELAADTELFDSIEIHA